MEDDKSLALKSNCLVTVRSFWLARVVIGLDFKNTAPVVGPVKDAEATVAVSGTLLVVDVVVAAATTMEG